MTEISSQEKSDNSQENHSNEQNQEGKLEQSLNALAFLTQDKNPQSENVNDNNQTEQIIQPNQESNQMENIAQETNNTLNQIVTPKGNSSVSSTSPNSPKTSQSAKQYEKIKTNQQNKSQNKEEPCDCSEEELDEHIENILSRRIPPPKGLRNPILQLLNRRRVQALVDGNYDYAEEQENNIKFYNRVIQSEDNKSNEEAQFEILFNRYQQLQKDHQEITEKWNEKINKYNEDEEQSYNELLQKQQEEKDKFHARWADPEYLRPFTKPSPKLNSMREQERAMAVARMYQQAKAMKQDADRLQKEETAAAQQRISRTMETEWNRMLERHENDRKKFIDHKNKNIAFLESEKQKELKPTMNAIYQIKSKKGLLLNTKQSSMTITKTAQEIEAQSPRTHKKYADFKSEKKKPKLNVQPVKDQQFQTTKKNTRSRSRLSKTQSQKQNESPKQQQSEAEKENLQTTENLDNQVEAENPNENVTIEKESVNQGENEQSLNATENKDDNPNDTNEGENENNAQDQTEHQGTDNILNKVSDALNTVARAKEEENIENATNEKTEENNVETTTNEKVESENKDDNPEIPKENN